MHDKQSLTLSPLWSAGAVIQRRHPITMWGRAKAGQAITVDFAGLGGTTTTDQTGAWQVTLPPLEAGGPYELTLRTDDEALTVPGIMVGDVWILGGQSNMEMSLNQCRFMYPWDIQAASHPGIRQFRWPFSYNFDQPLDDVTTGAWASATPSSVLEFSAAGYFFARRVHQVTGVPIGLLFTAVGGSPIQSWMSRDMLAPFPDITARLDQLTPTYVAKTLALDEAVTSQWEQEANDGDQGIRDGWQAPDLDDSSWAQHDITDPLPPDLQQSGVVWLRRVVDVPDDCAGSPATLVLGLLGDADEVWVDGLMVGNTPDRYATRTYSIDTLPAGRCVIAIRLRIPGGQGEITQGKFHLLHTMARDIDLDGLWHVRRGVLLDDLSEATVWQWEPAGLFNAMIHPLRRLGVKGVLWYQGESDAGRPGNYADRFAAMVRGWRSLFGDDALPFYWSQLAHYAPAPSHLDEWGAFRRRQAQCLALPHTAMVAATDIGDADDLHPANKRDIGERLAWAALTDTYGYDLGVSPYVLRSC